MMWSVWARQVVTIMGKDLRRELRTKELLTTTLAFSMLLMIVFTFSFYRDAQSTAWVFPGILWVSIAFAGTLALGRTFMDERDSGCLRALALIPGTARSLYIGKLTINALFMAIFELALVPLLLLSFDVSMPGRWGWFAAIVTLGTMGLTAMGTLLAAMLVHHRLREVMLPLLLYPLLVPLFIGGVKSVSALMDGQMETVWMWMRVMAGMDLAFLVGGQLLFGWVLSAIE